MSRRKKWGLGLLGVFALACAALFVFRYTLGSMVVDRFLEPFDGANAPSPPDYALASSWAALPDTEDAADALPPGLTEAERPTRDLVDVFYIHPTGFLDPGGNWNGDVAKTPGYAIPTSVMLGLQATAFNGCGRIYAPEYRQANIAVYIQPFLAPQRSDGFRALDLAYSDVARAFDYFIEHYSKGRPFIIASHSQGSGHALRLLAEKVDKTPLFSRLIAAYAVGCTTPADYFERVYENIKPCTSPTQLGSLIVWNARSENAWMPPIGICWYPTGWEYVGRRPQYCVNPLTWNSEPARVPATANLGALNARFVSADEDPRRFKLEGIAPEFTWAECRDGVLRVEEQMEGEFYNRFGDYHVFDYSLFWMNVRENARIRAEAFLRAQGQLPGSSENAI